MGRRLAGRNITLAVHNVIDGPPRGNALLRSCLAIADLCVIPIEPSGLSVRAADRIKARP